jgi:Icc-related predicted phosphoesterase
VKLKICCLSDMHGYLPEVPDCDLLLLGGDYPRNTRESYWFYKDEFKPWLQEIQERGTRIIGVAGNHDVLFETKPELIASLRLPWTYLQDRGTDYQGLLVWGSPWQPRYYDWAFNADEPELSQKWAMIPDETDILLLHAPPLGIGDQTTRGGGKRIGSASLLKRIKEIKPMLVVCGHNHAGHGSYQLFHKYQSAVNLGAEDVDLEVTESGADSDYTVVVNAALVDDDYQPTHQICLLDLNFEEDQSDEAA